MGTISRAGNCCGMDPDFMKKFEVSSWVPGGCFIIDTNKLKKIILILKVKPIAKI